MLFLYDLHQKKRHWKEISFDVIEVYLQRGFSKFYPLFAAVFLVRFLMYAKLYGATLYGIDGCIITVEVDISQGLPVFDIVGLPNQSVKEARERVRAAIKNSGYDFPMRRIVVNLAPATIRKSQCRTRFSDCFRGSHCIGADKGA